MATTQDEEHLKYLSIAYYVVGGLSALFACFPLIYVGMGVLFLTASVPQRAGPNEPPPAFIGGLFVGVGLLLMALLITMTVLLLLTGQALGRRERYTLCMVTAGLSCLSVPIGTVLGVFTLVVLSRPSVKALFGRGVEKPTEVIDLP